MYTQFFGNYLLANNLITKEQLFSAMRRMSDEHMRLGTLAINAGYMTSGEVNQVVIEQTHVDRKFGELAIDLGFLSNQQVVELLQEQSPDYLLLGQLLVDDGVLTYQDFEKIIADYRSANELIDLDMTQDNHDNIARLFENFLVVSEEPVSVYGRLYMELLFNNFVRFIGEDFTALDPEQISAYPPECCVSQKVLGDYSVTSYLSMDEATAIAFASRYVNEEFTEYDEYVQASLADFLNLHNGLFIVNTSNIESKELSITAPLEVESPVLEFTNRTYHFPILYSFGLVHFLFEVVHLPE